jgi:hypothetical protein
MEETESSSSTPSPAFAKPAPLRRPAGLRAGSMLMSNAIFSSSYRYGTRRLEATLNVTIFKVMVIRSSCLAGYNRKSDNAPHARTFSTRTVRYDGRAD